MIEEDKYISIAAYFKINGIKVSKPKEPDPNEIKWLKMDNSNSYLFSEDLIKNMNKARQQMGYPEVRIKR